MNFLKNLDRNYIVETVIPKTDMLLTLQEKIEVSKKESKWFSVDAIGYRRFNFWGDRLVVRYMPTFFDPFRGMGSIQMSFKQESNCSVISIKTIPLGATKEIGFWLNLFVLTLISVMALMLAKLVTALIIIAMAAILLWGGFLISVAYSRLRLFSYAKIILEDINVKEELRVPPSAS